MGSTPVNTKEGVIGRALKANESKFYAFRQLEEILRFENIPGTHIVASGLQKCGFEFPEGAGTSALWNLCQ